MAKVTYYHARKIVYFWLHYRGRYDWSTALEKAMSMSREGLLQNLHQIRLAGRLEELDA
jgi:hypothetical protein